MLIFKVFCWPWKGEGPEEIGAFCAVLVNLTKQRAVAD